jgi:excisionase family DNA binding protein
MPPLATIPLDHTRRTHPTSPQAPPRIRRAHSTPAQPARFAIPDPPDPATPGDARPFTPLIDARAASQLLGVPYTWLLAQARERRIPHHRLGHYVRFNPQDLQDWLKETRSMPHEPRLHTHRR